MSMSFELWMAFVLASALLVLIPGPTVLLVVSYALGQGFRAALPTAIGVALGDLTALTLSLLGLGALLAASAELFTVLKWAGACYLIWLGIKLWRSGARLSTQARAGAASGAKMLVHAWLVTALNPKSITFFVAFFPQFIDLRADFLSQMLILESTFIVLCFANAFGYAVLASRARDFAPGQRTVAAFNRVGGALLVGAGIATISTRVSQN